MSNIWKNTTLVTKLVTKAFQNEMMMLEKVDRQIDTSRVFSGKVGATVYVKRPLEFSVTDGAVIGAGDVEDIQEATVPITIDQRKKIVIDISSEEETLNLEGFNERIAKPIAKRLRQNVESAISNQYKYFPNFDGTPGTKPSSFLELANPAARMDTLGVPNDDERNAFFGPLEMATLSNALKGVFPKEIAVKAIENMGIGKYATFDCYQNQSLILHTCGNQGGVPLVNGASQNVTYAASKDTQSQNLITDGWSNSITDVLKAGDVFTLAGVYSVNRETKQNTGLLAQFVVLADTDSDGTGNATFSISPPMITSGSYQTVSAAPANNAVLTVLTGASGAQHLQNMVWHKNAITVAFAQLVEQNEGAVSRRENYKGVSLRVTTQYTMTNDEKRCRFDIFYGVKTQNPMWGLRITS